MLVSRGECVRGWAVMALCPEAASALAGGGFCDSLRFCSLCRFRVRHPVSDCGVLVLVPSVLGTGCQAHFFLWRRVVLCTVCLMRRVVSW